MKVRLLWLVALPEIQDVFIAAFTLSLFLCCMGYIDPNINKNDRKLQKHEKKEEEIFSFFVNVLFFPLLVQFSVCSLLPWLPFFIFRFMSIFRSFEILANISYFGV